VGERETTLTRCSPPPPPRTPAVSLEHYGEWLQQRGWPGVRDPGPPPLSGPPRRSGGVWLLLQRRVQLSGQQWTADHTDGSLARLPPSTHHTRTPRCPRRRAERIPTRPQRSRRLRGTFRAAPGCQQGCQRVCVCVCVVRVQERERASECVCEERERERERERSRITVHF
jgi:hypothetical protein